MQRVCRGGEGPSGSDCRGFLDRVLRWEHQLRQHVCAQLTLQPHPSIGPLHRALDGRQPQPHPSIAALSEEWLETSALALRIRINPGVHSIDGQQLLVARTRLSCLNHCH